jgi:nucleoside-diphosphate-sugar epimerase
MRIATIGASGFIGSHVMSWGRHQGLDMTAAWAPRLTTDDDWTGDSAPDWPRRHPAEFERLVEGLAGSEVVVNAAGLARPGSSDKRALRAANALLPAVVAQACRQAGVGRLVHVSTAAVQGRLDPLDETPRHFPFSPYSASKAEGERLLGIVDGPEETVLYRPTSVQGAERSTTRQIGRFAASPLVPIAGNGDQPLPVALVENVAAGIVFAATAPAMAPIVLQPWEGMTTRKLLELFGAERLVSVPGATVGGGLRLMGVSTRARPSLTATIRMLELLFQGQKVSALALVEAGFVPPVGEAGWSALAAHVSPAANRSSTRRQQSPEVRRS